MACGPIPGYQTCTYAPPAPPPPTGESPVAPPPQHSMTTTFELTGLVQVPGLGNVWTFEEAGYNPEICEIPVKLGALIVVVEG